MLAIAIGGLVGYMHSRSTANRYVVQAAFLMEREDSGREYERLRSRKLIADATAPFQVSRWVDHGALGLYEMYNESPFEVTVVAVTREVQNQPLPLRLLSADQYELSLPTADGLRPLVGKLGEVASFPGVQLSVVATKSLEPRDLEEQYFVSINSADAVANRFLSNLEVVHLADRPDRIGLIYTDDHPALAMDLLTAFTSAYLAEYQAQRLSLFTERLREVNAGMKILEAQILATDGADPFLQELATMSSQFSGADSAVMVLIKAQLEMANLEHRLAMLEAHRSGTLSRDTLEKALQKWEAADTLLSDTLSLSLANLDAVQQAYAQQLAATQARMLDRKSEFLAASTLDRVWQREWISMEDRELPAIFLLREKYLAAMEESVRIELEMRKDVVGPQLIDPPYPTAVLGRNLRIKNFATSMFAAIFLGIALALGLCMIDRRYRNYIHFAALGTDENLKVWRFGRDHQASRHQLVALKQRWGKTDKRIGFVGDAKHNEAVVRNLAAGLAGFGLKIAVVGVPALSEDPRIAHFDLPPDAAVGWWFSSEAIAKLHTLASDHDHVLVCLPFPREVPEAVAALMQMDASFAMLGPDQDSVATWKRWKADADEFGLAYEAIWLG